MQFLEDAETIWKVTHRIHGEDRVEARIVEWKLPARVYLQKTGASVETSLLRELPGGGDAFGEDVDADHGQADRFSEAKCRAARSAADVEEARFGTEVEPFREALELVDRQPARLAEVVAVRLPADLLSGAEAGVGGSVEGHVFPHVVQRNASGAGRSVANRARPVLASKASTKEETTMPTRVQFTSGESMTVAEGLDQANQQLGTQIAGLFNRVEGDNHTRVTVFASAVAYLQEMPDEEVAGGFL